MKSTQKIKLEMLLKRMINEVLTEGSRHRERNKLGDKYPQYFFPNVERNKYQTWSEFSKDKLFKNNKEIDLIRHWEKITGVAPNKNPPKKIVDMMNSLQIDI